MAGNSLYSSLTLRLAVLVLAGCGLPQKGRAQDFKCFDLSVPRQIVGDFGQYAKAIARSPAKLRHLNKRDALYLVGFSGATAALIATDTRISNSITADEGDRRASRYASNILVGAAIGTSTIKYFVGCHEHNRQRRDDAVREWESMGFALGSVGALKYIFRRERPGPLSNGDFFDSATSFPSGHSAIATAWAAVLGEEYPGYLWRYLALGGAGVTSFLRVTARQHYPSDVLVGGMIGHLTGSYICRDHKCREASPHAQAEPAIRAPEEHIAWAPYDPSGERNPALALARRQFCESVSSGENAATRCAK
ncbi:MAG TPA: phosphatase PAP2 family protein [Terriglobales bacterium]|nr:phosphatase PAP2 family protein [Terriglobales bacterium]